MREDFSIHLAIKTIYNSLEIMFLEAKALLEL